MTRRNAVVIRLLVASIIAFALNAHASPIAFRTAIYSTDTFVNAGGIFSFDDQSGPPSSLPISSSSTLANNSFAQAIAYATSGLLIGSSEADGFAPSSASGRSQFLGTFINSGQMTFVFDFDNFNLGGSGDLSLVLTNTSGGRLLDVDLTSGSVSIYNLFIPGGLSTLQITLTSQALGGPNSSSQNFSEVSFSGTVPLPATPLLLAIGLGALLIVYRGSRIGTFRSRAHVVESRSGHRD
jgi:hypothetical protein